ncbi:MAG: ubiquinone-binding protein [Alphaproteobacteria bacterium]|nr:MAG: ubiquinone-binding protein [Alphaproteobacteria bacterium]
MPTHAEQKHLPYTVEQMFDLVADIEKYHEFLPWCVACRKTKDKGGVIEADLIIGYKMIREKFKSRIILDRPEEIRVEYLDGPMKSLSNQWAFIRNSDNTCTIDFYVDIDLTNSMLQGVMNMFFEKAVTKMVGAFEDRAKELYGAKNNN